MATIFTVHGTFASGPESGEKWWQRGSPFHQHLEELVEGEDGPATFEPVIWDGANSETSRRLAGLQLYRRMARRDRKGEPYATIGHSHGGSVIAASLLESSRRRNKLKNLRLWVSIGTPFITTQKEWLLFTRLGLIGKSVYLALLTAFFLLFFAVLNRYDWADIQEDPIEFATIIGFIASPFIIFYIIMRIAESRRLHKHNRRTRNFAALHFLPRWTSLWHESDEAVQGLKSLKTLKLEVFTRDFAAPAITLVSAFLVPLAIGILAYSPAGMRDLVRLADSQNWMGPDTFSSLEELSRSKGRDSFRVGEADESLIEQMRDNGLDIAELFRAEAPLIFAAEELSIVEKLENKLLELRITFQRDWLLLTNNQILLDTATPEDIDALFQDRDLKDRQLLVERFRREKLNIDLLNEYYQSVRFSGHYFSENVGIVAAIIFESVPTQAGYDRNYFDNIDDVWLRWVTGFLRVLFFAFQLLVVALVVTILVRFAARAISGMLSRTLNPMTMGQIRASAFGSDTTEEYAVDASEWPMWFGKGWPPLPEPVSGELEASSDQAIGKVLPKFRDAVRALTSADTDRDKSDMISEYLTWDELIHTSYFHHPKFRKLIAYAISECEGFRPTEAFKTDPDYLLVAAWHRELEKQSVAPG